MKVVLLCGGIGQRMFPLTGDKSLLKFAGKTLLERQIGLAVEVGLTEFVIVGNPQNTARIEAIIANIPGIQASLAVQPEPLGTADALTRAGHLLDGEIIVVNPNDVFDISAYARLLESGHTDPAAACLLGYEVNGHFPGGYLVTNNTGNLLKIVEKPEPGQEPSNLVNIMLHRHPDGAALLQYIATTRSKGDDVYEQALNSIARREAHGVKVIPYSGPWRAIKYPWHILGAVQQFLNQKYIAPSAYVSSKATITGQVILSDNVKVMENAVIRGPVYIGPNTIIGNGCLVRDYSHIGANCVIGYGTEIKGSYIGEGCWFHQNYVGDSVIGNGCLFGAGAVTANFRFDESNVLINIEGEPVDTGLDKFGAVIGNQCRLGVNASVMPGRKIGANSIVGPNVCLMEDLEPDTAILLQPSGQIVKEKRPPESA
jgi:bifunctional UDP-N-acetylglucosamine pyrophosphorylase/glucosamine-1-phosphate N-acetyltransferase